MCSHARACSHVGRLVHKPVGCCLCCQQLWTQNNDHGTKKMRPRPARLVEDHGAHRHDKPLPLPLDEAGDTSEVTPNAPGNSLVKAETARRTARTGRVLWPRSPWTGPPSGKGCGRSQRVCFPTVLPLLRGKKRSRGPMAEPTQGGRAGAEHGPLTHGPKGGFGQAWRQGRTQGFESSLQRTHEPVCPRLTWQRTG